MEKLRSRLDTPQMDAFALALGGALELGFAIHGMLGLAAGQTGTLSPHLFGMVVLAVAVGAGWSFTLAAQKYVEALQSR